MITTGNTDTSKSTSWKVLETALSHLKEVLLVFDEDRVTGFFTPPRYVENDGNVMSLERTDTIER